MTERRDKDLKKGEDRADDAKPRKGNGLTAPFALPPEGRSLGSLIKDLADEGARLIREEMRLAQTEMREKLEVYQRNTMKLIVGSVLLLGAFGLLLLAANYGLTVVLTRFVPIEAAVWLSPLLLAVIAGVVGWGMTQSARKEMTDEGITPTRTIETLRQDKDWITQQARELRNG